MSSIEWSQRALKQVATRLECLITDLMDGYEITRKEALELINLVMPKE